MSLHTSNFFVLISVTVLDSRNCPHQGGGLKPFANKEFQMPLCLFPSHSLTHITPFLYALLTGHLPFHTIAKLSTVHRKRRDVEAEGSSNKLAFSLRLSNVTHSFKMSLSTDLLSPHYVLEEVSEDGRLVTVPSTVKDCYYIQDIRQSGLSAVTVCNHTVVSNVPCFTCACVFTHTHHMYVSMHILCGLWIVILSNAQLQWCRDLVASLHSRQQMQLYVCMLIQ